MNEGRPGGRSLSIRQLERLFRRYLHVSPAKYYKNARLDLARGLVQETNLPAKEIAAACGFSISGQFCKNYSQRFCQSPHNRRRSNAHMKPAT